MDMSLGEAASGNGSCIATLEELPLRPSRDVVPRDRVLEEPPLVVGRVPRVAILKEPARVAIVEEPPRVRGATRVAIHHGSWSARCNPYHQHVTGNVCHMT